MSTTNIVDGTWAVNTLYLRGPSVGVAPSLIRVTSDPNGTVTQFGGSLALDPVKGWVYTNASSGSSSGTVWLPLARASAAGNDGVCRIFSLTNPISDFGDNAGASNYSPLSIPINVFQAGSTLQCRVSGNLSQSGAGTVRFQFYAQDTFTTLLADSGTLAFANNNSIVMDVSSTIRGSGAAAGTSGSILGSVSSTGFGGQSVSSNLNTGVNNALSMRVTFSAPGVGTNFDINQFEVYLSR